MNGIIYVVQFALCHNVPAWQNWMAMNKTSVLSMGAGLVLLVPDGLKTAAWNDSLFLQTSALCCQ